MKKRPSAFAPSERGQAIVLLVLLFIALLGVVALAVDGGRLYLERRSAQNAADNAALAGAYALCREQNVTSAATTSAIQNGFDPSLTSVDLAVSNPPSSGVHAGDADFVAVTVTTRPPMAFARLVYSGVAEASASAVAECIKGGGPVAGGNGVVALDSSTDRVIENTGSGCLIVNNGGVFVNSTHSSALYLDGGNDCAYGGPRVSGDWIQVVGGASIPAWVNVQPSPVQTSVSAISDPLASVPAPAVPAFAAAPDMPGCSPSFISGVYSAGNLNLGNHWCTSQVTVKPGRYTSFTITSDARAVMQPGLYYIQGGNFTISGAAAVQANDIMIYLSSGAVQVQASGNVDITAATTGEYAGMAFYMDRTNTSNFTVDGAGVTLVRGTIYAPAATVVAAGSGASTTLNSQMIAARYRISGAARLYIDYDPEVVYSGGGSGGSTFIQLSE